MAKYFVTYNYKIDNSWRDDPPLVSFTYSDTAIMELSDEEISKDSIMKKLLSESVIITKIKNITKIT